MQVTPDRTSRRADIGADGDVAVMRERADGIGIIEDENKIGDLRANLETKTCPARSDERGARPALTGARHDDTLTAFAAKTKSHFDYADDGETTGVPQNILRNAFLRHGAELPENADRLINDFLFGRGTRGERGEADEGAEKCKTFHRDCSSGVFSANARPLLDSALSSAEDGARADARAMESIIDLQSDSYFMGEALRLARKAYAAEEVPIGAVVVREGVVIARASNQVEMLKDATAHAEMLAMTQAEAAVGDWRLSDCDLYVTKEPCPMCAGALVHVRMRRVIFGCRDERGGAAGGLMNLLQQPSLNHRCEITAGVLAEDCAALLQSFFRAKRGREIPDA